jgi:prophage DNA circulation protein
MQRNDTDNADTRLTALEVKTNALEEQHKSYNADMSLMRDALSVIRSDVSFIRGQMEGAAGKR